MYAKAANLRIGCISSVLNEQKRELAHVFGDSSMAIRGIRDFSPAVWEKCGSTMDPATASTLPVAGHRSYCCCAGEIRDPSNVTLRRRGNYWRSWTDENHAIRCSGLPPFTGSASRIHHGSL